jgi:hypothetical protein
MSDEQSLRASCCTEQITRAALTKANERLTAWEPVVRAAIEAEAHCACEVCEPCPTCEQLGDAVRAIPAGHRPDQHWDPMQDEHGRWLSDSAPDSSAEPSRQNAGKGVGMPSAPVLGPVHPDTEQERRCGTCRHWLESVRHDWGRCMFHSRLRGSGTFYRVGESCDHWTAKGGAKTSRPTGSDPEVAPPGRYRGRRW